MRVGVVIVQRKPAERVCDVWLSALSSEVTEAHKRRAGKLRVRGAFRRAERRENTRFKLHFERLDEGPLVGVDHGNDETAQSRDGVC